MFYDILLVHHVKTKYQYIIPYCINNIDMIHIILLTHMSYKCIRCNAIVVQIIRIGYVSDFNMFK